MNYLTNYFLTILFFVSLNAFCAVNNFDKVDTISQIEISNSNSVLFKPCNVFINTKQAELMNTINFENNQAITKADIKITPIINYINSSKELQIKLAKFVDIEEIRLYSILGQNLKQWSNIKPNIPGNYSFSLSNLTKGTYVVSVKTSQGKFNKRLIITE